MHLSARSKRCEIVDRPDRTAHDSTHVSSDPLALRNQHVGARGGPGRPIHRVGQRLHLRGEVAQPVGGTEHPARHRHLQKQKACQGGGPSAPDIAVAGIIWHVSWPLASLRGDCSPATAWKVILLPKAAQLARPARRADRERSGRQARGSRARPRRPAEPGNRNTGGLGPCSCSIKRR